MPSGPCPEGSQNLQLEYHRVPIYRRGIAHQFLSGRCGEHIVICLNDIKDWLIGVLDEVSRSVLQRD